MQGSLLCVRGTQGNSSFHTGKLLRSRTRHASACWQCGCRQVGRSQQGKGPFFFADALLLGRAERCLPQRRTGAVEGSKPLGKALILVRGLQQYEELIQHLEVQDLERSAQRHETVPRLQRMIQGSLLLLLYT